MVSADFSLESHFSRQCAGSASPTQRAHTGLQHKGETEGAYTAPILFLQSQGRVTFFLLLFRQMFLETLEAFVLVITTLYTLECS